MTEQEIIRWLKCAGAVYGGYMTNETHRRYCRMAKEGKIRQDGNWFYAL